MANMSYCRFENTYRDLKDCYDSMTDKLEPGSTEHDYRKHIVRLCAQILEECTDATVDYEGQFPVITEYDDEEEED